MTADCLTDPGYRFPAEIISHAVWLYHVFSLSLRDLELILAERGITVTHGEHPELVPEVRFGVRPQTSTPPAEARRHLAP